MKRILLSFALALTCISVAGQETDAWPRFEMNWGYGMFPLIQAERFNEGSAWRIGAGSLGSIYRPYTSEVRMTGAFSAEFGYRTSRKWTISLMTSFNQVFGARSIQAFHSGDDYQVNFRMESVNGYNIAIIPRWRYDYIIKPGFRMYSSFGMGFGLYVNYHTGEDSYYEPVQGEIQLVPLGITFGRKWFGLVETGFGSQYVGGRIGFGYRF